MLVLRACPVKFMVGAFYHATRRGAESRRAITSVRPRAIKISSLDMSVRYSLRFAHARFIIHFTEWQPAARLWFLPRALFRFSARKFFFFSLFFFITSWIWYTWYDADRCRQCIKCMLAFSLNAASINIPYSLMRKIRCTIWKLATI